MGMETKITCAHHRTRGPGAPWLVMLYIAGDFFSSPHRVMPSCNAVMDDFGTLVIVGEWF
jgi:hypothetical protein